MRVETCSYRFATEIIQHPNFINAWQEISSVLAAAPLFIYPGKSEKNKKLDVVQQLLNTYFDRRFVVDHGWLSHPLATRIQDSGLRADLRKTFGALTIQAEIQFGNMSRWYSDIFKFQTAYSQGLIQMGLSVVPLASLAGRIDSNVVNFERCWRELPSAELSITLPILLVGLALDENTPIVDVSLCQFAGIKDITGKGQFSNILRIVNGFIEGKLMGEISPESSIGPIPSSTEPQYEDIFGEQEPSEPK